MTLLILPLHLFDRIFSVLSAVLHIGNINFRKASEQDYVTVKNIATVKVVSDLLKVKTETLMLALTKRKSVARGEQFFVQYRMAEVCAEYNMSYTV